MKKDEEWKGRVKSLEDSVIGGKRDSLQQQLINALQGDYHVDAWAAQKAIDKTVLDRIQVGLDGTYKVYQEDGQTPYQPAEGQSPISLLAKEIVGTIPESLIRPPKNNGSNYKGSSPNGAASSTKKRSEFSRQDRIDFITQHGREAYETLPI